jgi:phospholipid transport system substrate-binding protein
LLVFRKLSAICLWLLAASFAPGAAFATTAAEQLKATIQEFAGILANTPVAELRAPGLPEAARKLVFARFDFSEMSRRSLGQYWGSLKPGEQAEFVAALAQRMLFAYGRTLRSGGESILYKAESRDGETVRVETEVFSSGQPVAIHYYLHEVEGEWKVFDMAIDDVSVVRNFQAQFRRVIARSSLQELLQKMKKVSF